MPEHLLDTLHAGSFADFVARRKDLANRAKDARNADEQAELTGASKPTLAAWAVNQLVHHHLEQVERVLSESDRMRDVQRALMGGEAEAEDLRAQMRAYRSALESAVAVATDVLRDEGQKASARTLDQVRDTLRAASFGSHAVRDEVLTGHLERELAAPIGLDAALPVAERRADAAGRSESEGAHGRGARGARGRARARTEKARTEKARAREAEAEAKRAAQARRALRSALRDAERRGKRADRERERAQEALTEAEADVQDKERELE